MSAERHDIEIRSAARRTWAQCTCGWRGSDWTTATGATLDFGQHITPTPTTTDEGHES